MFQMAFTCARSCVEAYAIKGLSGGDVCDGHLGQLILQCVLPIYKGLFSEPLKRGHCNKKTANV